MTNKIKPIRKGKQIFKRMLPEDDLIINSQTEQSSEVAGLKDNLLSKSDTSTNNPLSLAEEIIKGCKNKVVHYDNRSPQLWRMCGERENHLCPTCQSSRTTAIKIFEEELDFLETETTHISGDYIDWIRLRLNKRINLLIKALGVLKK